MAVQILNAWTLASTATTAPGSLTVSAGTDRVLFYATLLRDNPAQEVLTVTYGGQSMTRVAHNETAGAGGNDIHAAIWMLDEAGIQAASSNAFAITREDVDGVRYRAFAASYQIVDQTDPIVDQFAVIGEAGTDPTPEALDTVNAGFVVACQNGADSSGGTQDITWSNLTQQLENGDLVHYMSVAHAAVTLAGTLTPAFSLTADTQSVMWGISLRAANRNIAVGLASETDTALSVRPLRTYPVGLASETDTALAFTYARGAQVGLTTETDAALSIRPAHSVILDATEEADAALPIRHSRGAQVNTALETDTALAFLHDIDLAIGLSTETDTAFAIAHSKTVRIGVAEQTDTSLSVEPIVSTGARLLNPWTLRSDFVDFPGSLSVLPGADRWIFYKVTIRDGVPQEVTSVTYGGQPMVQLVSAKTNGVGADLHSSVWGLNEAGIQAATSESFALTRTGTDGIVFRAHAATYQGADQVNPIVDSFSAVGNSGVAPVPEALATLDRGILVSWLSGADQGPGGAQDAIWSNVIERLETRTSTIYMSVAAIGTDGLDITPTVSLSNQTNTILQGVVLSPVTVDIFIPVGVAQETEVPLAIGANEPTIELLAPAGTTVDANALSMTGLTTPADTRALVVGASVLLDQTHSTDTVTMTATATYAGVPLERFDSFGTTLGKDRAQLLLFRLDVPDIVPSSGNIEITVTLSGGARFEAISAVGAFLRGPEQLAVNVLDSSELLLPGLSITDSATVEEGGLVLAFTAASGTGILAGDIRFGERAHQRDIEGVNTSTSLLLEERRGGGGGAFSRTATIDTATLLRSITLQVVKLASIDVEISFAEDTSAAEAFTFSKLQDILPADETDEAFTIVPLRTRAIGIAEELDAALTIFAQEITTLSIAEETDAALSVRPLRTRAIGLASETAQAFSISVVNASKIVLAQAWTLITNSAALAVIGRPFTTNAGSNRLLLVAIAEESTSHEPTVVTYGGVAMTLLTNPIPVIGGFPLTLSIYGALESQLTAALDNVIDVTTDGLHDGSFRLYAAVYHNVRQTPSPLIDYDSSTGNGVVAAGRTIDVRARGRAVAMFADGTGSTNVTWTGVTEQIETATVGFYVSIADVSTDHGTLAITPSTGSPANNALVTISLAAAGRTIPVNQTEEVQAGLSVLPNRIKSVGLASETDVTFGVSPTFRGRVFIALALETDQALSFEALLDRTIKPARETDEALIIRPGVILVSNPDRIHTVEGDLEVIFQVRGNYTPLATIEGSLDEPITIRGRL